MPSRHPGPVQSGPVQARACLWKGGDHMFRKRTSASSPQPDTRADVTALGDATTLTRGGQSGGVESKRHPYG